EERQVNRTRRWAKTGNYHPLAHVLDCPCRSDDIVSLKDLRGHGRERVSELVVAAESLQNNKDKNIQRDDRVVNERSRCPVGIVVVKRKNHGSPRAATQARLRPRIHADKRRSAFSAFSRGFNNS